MKFRINLHWSSGPSSSCTVKGVGIHGDVSDVSDRKYDDDKTLGGLLDSTDKMPLSEIKSGN